MHPTAWRGIGCTGEVDTLRDKIRMGTGIAGCVLLFCYPAEALEAAREAIYIWGDVFAPSMFPFFVMMGALCGQHAVALYDKVFGRVTKTWFGCPGGVSGAIMIAWMAGSPAGAIGLKKSAQRLNHAERSRAAILVSGLSPAFLMGVVGVGMLQSANAGRILVCAQLLAYLGAGFIFKRAWVSDDAMDESAVLEEAAIVHPVREAAFQVIGVCGWMVMFSVFARMATMVIPSGGQYLLPVLEITGGCVTLATMPVTDTLRLLYIAFFCGLGGVSIFLQNRVYWPHVPMRRLILGKLCIACLMTGFTFLQMCLPALTIAWPLSAFETALFFGGTLTIIIALWMAFAQYRQNGGNLRARH